MIAWLRECEVKEQLSRSLAGAWVVALASGGVRIGRPWWACKASQATSGITRQKSED